MELPSLGAFIRYARERRGLSQRELSSRTGRSPAYVSRLESDQIEEPGFIPIAVILVELDLTPLEIWTLVRAQAQRGRQDGDGLTPGVELVQ